MVDQETMKNNASPMPISFFICKEIRNRTMVIYWSWFCKEVVLYGTIWRKGCCWNSQKADIQFSVLQVHCPEVDSEAKAMENCRCTVVPIWKRLRLFFRIIAKVNQLSLYGAVAEMCEEYESFHDRTEKPVVGGQSNSSFVPSVIKTDVPLDCDDLAPKIFYCNSTENELKSYHNKIN